MFSKPCGGEVEELYLKNSRRGPRHIGRWGIEMELRNDMDGVLHSP